MEVIKATKEQLQAIHAALFMRRLLRHKADIIDGVTQGRSSSSKDLTFDEAHALLTDLNREDKPKDNSKLLSKLFEWHLKWAG